MSPSPPVKPFHSFRSTFGPVYVLAAVAGRGRAAVGRSSPQPARDRAVAAPSPTPRPSTRRRLRKFSFMGVLLGGSGYWGRAKRRRFQEAAARRTRQVPLSTAGAGNVAGTTRSGASAVLVSGRRRRGRRVRRRRRRPNARRSRSSVRSVEPRLTAKTASAPVSSSCTAVGVDRRRRRRTGRCRARVTPASVRSTVPRACRAVSANGWKMVCRQAGPPVLGPDRGDDVDQLRLAGDADPVGVAQQGDEQVADDDRVGGGVACPRSAPALPPSPGGPGRTAGATGTRRSTRRTRA